MTQNGQVQASNSHVALVKSLEKHNFTLIIATLLYIIQYARNLVVFTRIARLQGRDQNYARDTYMNKTQTVDNSNS